MAVLQTTFSLGISLAKILEGQGALSATSTMQKGVRTESAKPVFDVPYLVAYGTLRRRSQYRLGHSVGSYLKFYGYGLLRGLRLAQREYPVVLERPGLVQVEIFRVLNESVWAILDRYEGYDPRIGKNSLFVRKAVALVRPQIYAWVYFLGPDLRHGRLIEML